MRKHSFFALALTSGLSLALLSTPAPAFADTKAAVEGGAYPEPSAAHVTVGEAPVDAEHIVGVAPPAPKAETKPPPPTHKEWVWVAGHWKWEPGPKSHVWVPGHWEKHKAGHAWVHAHWQFHGGKYYFIPGHWQVWGVPGGAVPEHTTPHIVGTEAPVGALHVVTVAPPALKVEIKPAPPSHEHIWVGGHWSWAPASKSHVWVPGHWEQHKVGHTWVHAHWVFFGGKYHFVQGYWHAGNPHGSTPEHTTAHIVGTEAPAGALHVVAIAPPAPKVESKGIAPSHKHVWVGGHWNWVPASKSHVWVPGHWEVHKVGHVWVHAHWVFFGGKYHLVAGYWRKA